MFKFNLKKIKLKNNLFNSLQEKAQETSFNNSKSKSDLNNTKSSKIKAVDINLKNKIIDKLKSKIILNENNLFKFDSNNSRNKKLAILKKGKIYWLRKLYIIFENTIIKINKKLYFYFYYPIKDINMEKNKLILYQSYQNESKSDIFCDNLCDILQAIKTFLKNNKILKIIKINLYTENFTLIKSDNQLMAKMEKYKILYAKIIIASEELNDKKISRVFSHDNFSNNYKKEINNLFNNIFIKNRLSLYAFPLNKKKNYSSNINIKSNNNITNSLDELILDDIDDIAKINKKRSNTIYFLNYKKDKAYIMFRNNTVNLFKNMKIRKNQMPMIKSKKLLKCKLSLNSEYNNFRSYKNIKMIKNKFEKFKSEETENNNNLINEGNNTIVPIYNKYKINLKYNNNKLSLYNNKSEMNQILFIALNSLVKNFVEDKLDDYISNEEIKEIFDIEAIIINLSGSNINLDIDVYIFLKEFLLYLYLSNYINIYHKEFCLDIYKILKEKDYIDINNILSINSFKSLIYDVKNIFEFLKSNKNIMTKKLEANYIKSENNISFSYFILFIVYNRNNFRKIFNKKLLFNILNNLNSNFNIDLLENGISVEQYIKFKLYFIKNKLIDEDLKKEFIKNLFKNTVFNNDDFNKNNYIIQIRNIINNPDIINKITNKKDLDDSSLIDVYNKFIYYFNFY